MSIGRGSHLTDRMLANRPLHIWVKFFVQYPPRMPTSFAAACLPDRLRLHGRKIRPRQNSQGVPRAVDHVSGDVPRRLDVHDLRVREKDKQPEREALRRRDAHKTC